MMSNREKVLLSLFLVFMIIPVYAYAGSLSDDAQMCLGCHSGKDVTKQLENKEVLSLFINGDAFANSVHNATGCGGCHTDISMDNHPQPKKIKSKKDYSASNSNSCSMCHMEDQLKKKQMHGYLISRTKNISCAECHGAHYITSLAKWKTGLSEMQYCLSCHKYDISMTHGSGETMSLQVNEAAMKGSAHGSLSCGACHMDFSKSDHPVRTFKSKKEYTANAIKVCTLCHREEELRKSPAHSTSISKASCTDCHGFHTVKGIKAQKATAQDTQYCLSCHKSKLSMTMKNGESLSVYVDEAEHKKSVHGKLSCTQCHATFSKTAHPARSFSSKRDYSLSSLSEVCKKCHADAFTKYEAGVHYSLMKSGNSKAPSCAECHGGAHSVAKTDTSTGMKSCNKCHSDMNSSYEASVHNKARQAGKANAPVCSSCHNAHDVQMTGMTTQIKDGCLKCHSNAGELHAKWLWNPPIPSSTFAATHFDVVSCAACHATGATRVISLIPHECSTRKPLMQEDLAALLNTDVEGLMGKMDINGDKSLDASEIWDLYVTLWKKDTRSTFLGKMDVSSGAEAHRIGSKSEAIRACEKCHQTGADYFKKVSFVVAGSDGKRAVYEAKSDVLNSIYTILPASKFYALGGTSIKLFDILFVVALIGGIAVPIGHISLRVITSPLRSLRKMGKGGKK
jgi:predicted CXXCH cytochrome family protein